jgi:hypothetical protein
MCDASPGIVWLLIDSIESKRIVLADPKFRLYLAVVASVVGACRPEVLFTAFSKRWQKLFPDDPFAMVETLPRDLANHCLYHCVKSVEHSRGPILEEIASFVAAGDASVRIYHFLLLLIRLLADSTMPTFLQALTKSSLLPILLGLAQSDLAIFDFVRMCSYRSPEECLSRVEYVNFFNESFFDDEKRQSVIACFACGFSPGTDAAMHALAQENIISAIVAIGQRCIGIGSELVFELFSVIESAVSCFSGAIAEFACQAGLIGLVSDIAVAFPAKFPLCAGVLSTLSQQNRTILNFLTSDEMSLYAKLEEATVKAPPTLEKAKAIMDLATIFRPAKGATSIVRNYKAIELLLTCAKSSPEGEPWITGELTKLAAYAPNLRQFGKGKVVAMVIDRILEIQADDGLRLIYFGILKLISDQVFTVPTYSRTVELVVNESFDYPHEFVQLYIDSLAVKPIPAPPSFYAIDEKEGGIFVSPIQVGDTFLVCVSFRLDSL